MGDMKRIDSEKPLIDPLALPVEDQIRVLFEVTPALLDVAQRHLVPVLQRVMEPTELEDCLRGTYYHMILWMETLAALGPNPRHFQAASSGARTLSELLFDIRQLVDDPSLAAKYAAYTRVARFQAAQKAVKYLRAHPDVDQSEQAEAQRFVDDAHRRAKIEKLVERHWGRKKSGALNWPTRWHNDARQMAGDPYEEIYCYEFPRLNCYVHGSGAGFEHLSRDAFPRVFAIAHVLAQRVFHEATMLIAAKFHLSKALPDLGLQIEAAKRAAAAFLARRDLEMRRQLEVAKAAPTEEPYALSALGELATDMGVTDLADRHDAYAHGAIGGAASE